MTAVTAARTAGEDGGPPVGRVIAPRRGLPGGRAVLGGLLMAVAAVGVLLAYRGSGDTAGQTVVVAAHELRPGQRLASRDVRLVAADLPSASRAMAFPSVDAVIGRVVLGPVAEGELLQRGGLTADDGAAANEIAVTLPRANVAVGRLKPGERVDVYVTRDERTTSVVRGVMVVQIVADADRPVTSERDVEIVVAVDSGEAVAALVHAMRTGEVTIVRSTFSSERAGAPLVHEPAPGPGGADPDDRRGDSSAG